jgi:hypothetical protein
MAAQGNASSRSNMTSNLLDSERLSPNGQGTTAVSELGRQLSVHGRQSLSEPGIDYACRENNIPCDSVIG